MRQAGEGERSDPGKRHRLRPVGAGSHPQEVTCRTTPVIARGAYSAKLVTVFFVPIFAEKT